MALLCADCASSNTTTGLGEHVSCGDCGAHKPHRHAGEPSLHGDSNPEPADTTEADAEPEAEPEADDEAGA